MADRIFNKPTDDVASDNIDRLTGDEGKLDLNNKKMKAGNQDTDSTGTQGAGATGRTDVSKDSKVSQERPDLDKVPLV